MFLYSNNKITISDKAFSNIFLSYSVEKMNNVNNLIRELDNLSTTQLRNWLKNKKKDSINNIIKAIEINIDKEIITKALLQIGDD